MDDLSNFELVGAYMHEDNGTRYIGYRFKNLDTSTPEKDDIHEYFEQIPFGTTPFQFIQERKFTHTALLSLLGQIH